jgi:hypothetical protein
MEYWVLGAQFVSMNQQTKDLGMLLNYAWFKLNGGVKCGYVLKPQFMYDIHHQFDPQAHCMDQPIMELGVEIISGQQIPKPDSADKEGDIVDPFVEV